MNDNTKIYLGEKAAEMIAHGVDEEIKKRATNYSLCADGDGIQIDGGFGGRIFSSDLDYSTEEQLTGKRWIDGKPIYQKTIFYEGDIKNTSNFSIQHGISDLEIIVFSFVATKRKDGFIWEQINISDGSEKARYNINENSIDILYNWDPTQYLLATIQYTKTTDTELSPVSLPKIKSTHNYSTEEQVVGTWIDGKPIYEKVINSGYLANNNSISIDVSHLNINDVIQLKGIAFTDDKKQFRPITLGTSDSNAIRIDFTNNLAERGIKPFVILRKNSLFSNTENGAEASCILMSIAQTAKMNLLKPDKYIEYVLERIDDTSTSLLNTLSPTNKNLPQELKYKKEDAE